MQVDVDVVTRLLLVCKKSSKGIHFVVIRDQSVLPNSSMEIRGNLSPGVGLKIEFLKIREVVLSIPSSKQVQSVVENHRLGAGSCGRRLSKSLDLFPLFAIKVESPKVSAVSLLSIASKDVHVVIVDGCAVRSDHGSLLVRDDLGPLHGLEVQLVEIVLGFLSVPASIDPHLASILDCSLSTSARGNSATGPDYCQRSLVKVQCKELIGIALVGSVASKEVSLRFVDDGRVLSGLHAREDGVVSIVRVDVQGDLLPSLSCEIESPEVRFHLRDEIRRTRTVSVSSVDPHATVVLNGNGTQSGRRQGFAANGKLDDETRPQSLIGDQDVVPLSVNQLHAIQIRQRFHKGKDVQLHFIGKIFEQALLRDDFRVLPVGLLLGCNVVEMGGPIPQLLEWFSDTVSREHLVMISWVRVVRWFRRDLRVAFGIIG